MVPLKVVVSEFAVGITYTVMEKFYKKLISKWLFFVFQFKQKKTEKPTNQKNKKTPVHVCPLRCNKHLDQSKYLVATFMVIEILNTSIHLEGRNVYRSWHWLLSLLDVAMAFAGL